MEAELTVDALPGLYEGPDALARLGRRDGGGYLGGVKRFVAHNDHPSARPRYPDVLC
jgi:hypothetical protein